MFQNLEVEIIGPHLLSLRHVRRYTVNEFILTLVLRGDTIRYTSLPVLPYLVVPAANETNKLTCVSQ